MADVSQLRDADRAQLFLVGALALSVIFIVLAVLLNTAIYTGNIATRDPGPGTGEVIKYEQSATSMATHAIGTVNDRNNSSYTDLRLTFENTVSVWSETANVHPATKLADNHVAIVTTNRGSKIGQEQADAFTDDNETDDWTVANNTTVRAFRLNVSQQSLVNTTGSLTDTFYVEFEDASGAEWRVHVYREGTGNLSVDVLDSSRAQVGATCSAAPGSDNHVTVKLSTAKVGGARCSPITLLFENVSAPYDVNYGNALTDTDDETINGTYSVIVNRPIDALATGADDDNRSEPYATPALYSAELQMTQRSPVTYYRTNIRIAPEEPDV